MKKNIIWILLAMTVLTSCSAFENSSPQAEVETVEIEEKLTTELIEAAPIEMNIAVSSGGMALFSVRQFYEQKSYSESLQFNYSMYHSSEGLERDMSDKKVDMGLMPLDFLLQTGGALSDYKIMGLVSTAFPQFVSKEKGVTLDQLKKKNVDVFYEHELFFRAFLQENGINPNSDVNVVVWTDEEKMIETYKDGKIDYALFSMAQSQKLIGQGVELNTVLDLNSFIINKLGSNGGIPTGVFVVRKDILAIYPEVAVSFENDLLYNNKWLVRNYDAAKVYARQLELVEENFDYMKFLGTAEYYYEPVQVSKYKFKKYYKWVDNYLTDDVELGGTLFQRD